MDEEQTIVDNATVEEQDTIESICEDLSSAQAQLDDCLEEFTESQCELLQLANMLGSSVLVKLSARMSRVRVLAQSALGSFVDAQLKLEVIGMEPGDDDA
jgi:hypothetical protein